MTCEHASVIELWHTTVPFANASYLDQGLALLSSGQRQRVLRYRRLSDQMLHLTGRLLVRHYLRQAALPFSLNDWRESDTGKPFLPNGPCFNISHAGNQVVAAFSHQAVGVDIELRQDVDVAALARYLHPAEQRFIGAAAQPANAFFTLWTRKEALLKAIGEGIAKHLGTHNTLLSEVFMNHTRWQLHNIAAGAGYSMALATPLLHATWRLVEIQPHWLVRNP